MISVCLPVWKRQRELEALLDDLVRFYDDLPLEISVCDDGSPEPVVLPDRVVHPMGWFPAVLTRLPAKARPLNPCVPINRAVDASHGDVIVLTGPEVRHEEPVLRELVGLIEGPMDYACARCWDVDRGMWIAGPEVNYRTHGRMPPPPGSHFHFLVAFTRTLWEQAGGFDEDYRNGQGFDDADWLWRAWRAGAQFKTTEGRVLHTRSDTRWGVPSNRNLYVSKWPEALAPESATR